MDNNTAIILIVALFALIVVGGFLVYRKRSKVDIKTPLGSLTMESANEDPPQQNPGVTIENAKAGGTILGEDSTGKGTRISDAEAGEDIIGTSTTPGDSPDPKA